LLCIEIPAALRHFRVVILIQIGVERNERVIERIALDPDPRRTRLGCRDNYFIDATGVPFQRQLPGLAGFDPNPPAIFVGFAATQPVCLAIRLMP
jgi:hypothetical protein